MDLARFQRVNKRMGESNVADWVNSVANELLVLAEWRNLKQWRGQCNVILDSRSLSYP